MGQQRRKFAAGTLEVKVASGGTVYEDFVIVAKRKSTRAIGIRVEASPAGRMSKQVTVLFPAQDVQNCAQASPVRARKLGGC